MGSPWTHDPPETVPTAAGSTRRRRLIIGGVAATVLVLAALAVALWPHPSQDPSTADGGPSAGSSPTVVGCATWYVTEHDPTSSSLAIAPTVTWSLVGGEAAPSSIATGPASSEPVRWCYAPTSAGALVAVSNFVAQQVDWTISRRDLLTHTIADTPARQYALDEVDSRPISGEAPNRPASPTRGFRFIAYVPEVSAQIELVHEWRGQLVAGAYDLRYESGDWRIVLPPSWEFSQRVVSTGADLDTSLYTPWGP
jgi:hypothetical protein